MNQGGYQFQSEFVRKNVAHGMAQGCIQTNAKAVLTVLEARGFEVEPALRQRVLECTDLDTLERWLRRAVTIAAASELATEPEL